MQDYAMDAPFHWSANGFSQHVFADIPFKFEKTTRALQCILYTRGTTRVASCGPSVHPSGVVVSHGTAQASCAHRPCVDISYNHRTTTTTTSTTPTRRHISLPRQPPRRRTDRNCCLHGAPSNYAYWRRRHHSFNGGVGQEGPRQGEDTLAH